MNIKKKILYLLFNEKNTAACPWSLADIALVAILIALFIIKDPLHLGVEVLKYLRLHFFIFTREPKLFYYLGTSINTIIFKFVLIFFVLIAVKLRRVSFWNSIVFTGKIPAGWYRAWLPIFAGVSVVLRLISMSNPLVPNLPFCSVFPEAMITGNIVIIFSILFVAPFIEEISFRGFLYPALNKYMGMYPSIFFTSALFTLAHYPQIKGEILFIAIIFILSLMITYAKAKTGSTWLAIVMHHVYNLMYIIVGFVSFLMIKY